MRVLYSPDPSFGCLFARMLTCVGTNGLAIAIDAAGNMDFSVVDASITITDEESFSTCHALAQSEVSYAVIGTTKR